MRSVPAATRSRMAAEVRREQILEVATEHFRRKPQADVSLDAIAEEIGVTRALINHHFGTKRGLYVEVVRRLLGSSAVVTVPDYVHGETSEQRLRQSVAALLADIDRDRELWLAAIRAGGMGDAEIFEIAEGARETAVTSMVATLGLGPMEVVTERQMALLRGWVGFGETIILQHLEYGRVTQDQACDMIVAGGVYCADTILAARERRDA